MLGPLRTPALGHEFLSKKLIRRSLRMDVLAKWRGDHLEIYEHGRLLIPGRALLLLPRVTVSTRTPVWLGPQWNKAKTTMIVVRFQRPNCVCENVFTSRTLDNFSIKWKNLLIRWPDCVRVQFFLRSRPPSTVDVRAQSTLLLWPTKYLPSSFYRSWWTSSARLPSILTERWVNANKRWQSAARTVLELM